AIFISARRRGVDRLPECRERIPSCAIELREPRGRVSHRRGPTESGRRTRGDPMNHKFENYTGPGKSLTRLLAFAILTGVLVIGAACSKDTPAATSKAPVTLDPDVFEAERPDLFKTAKAELLPLPTTVTANGVVSPDVNRTIHVTSLGSGRVVDLKAK